MNDTLTTEQKLDQEKYVRRIIFTVDLVSGKIISVTPVVDSDEELARLDRWIDGCVALVGLIRPATHATKEKVAA